MTNVIGVRFKSNCKMYYFDPCGQQVDVGDDVIVETARGLEFGQTVQGNKDVPDQAVVQPLKKMVRIATDADRQTVEKNQKRADEAFSICRQKIEERGLDMNLVTVECTFDMNKILFYFTADGRIDFRELVKDLASVFRTRIELRQIGVRDEAKMIGGLGACGRELCCSSYLESFHPVSINMAKDQNLSLNPAKISGTCGRLMCCLKYEHEAYSELQKVTPRIGCIVDTPEGRGRVVSTQMLRGVCRVQLDDSPEHTLSSFPCADCCQLRGGGKCPRSEGAATPQEGKGEDAPSARTERAPRSRPPRKDAPAQGLPQGNLPAQEPTAPQGAPGLSAEAEGGPEGTSTRRRRRRGGRRRNKKPGEGSASAQPQQVDANE